VREVPGSITPFKKPNDQSEPTQWKTNTL